MGILTNFLKLLKPEENDYYNAITEQAENWQKVDDWAKRIEDSNKKKLDAGSVSAEYNTGKKIEDKIKAAQKTADGKVSKTGDTMSGPLKISNNYDIISKVSTDGSNKFSVGYDPNGSVYVYNNTSKKYIRMFDDGSLGLESDNLQTTSKEVVGAVNELNTIKISKDDLWEVFHKHGTNVNVGNYTNQQFINLGLSSIYYTDSMNFNKKPSTYGQLININGDASHEVTQLWIDQVSGAIYSRTGNANTPAKDKDFKKMAMLEYSYVSGGNIVVAKYNTALKIIIVTDLSVTNGMVFSLPEAFETSFAAVFMDKFQGIVPIATEPIGTSQLRFHTRSNPVSVSGIVIGF